MGSIGGETTGGGGISSANSSSTSTTTSTQPLRLSFKLGGEKLSTLYTGQVSSPFYTLKARLPDPGYPIGSTDLLEHYDLAQAYQRFAAPGKIREDLESFLPHLYGNFHFTQSNDFSSLYRLVEKPPITGKEIVPLSQSAMSGFRLNAGPVDEAYRHLFDRRREELPSEDAMQRMDRTPAEILLSSQQQSSSTRNKEKRKKEHKEKKEKKKKKEKKRKHQDGDGGNGGDMGNNSIGEQMDVS